MRMLTGPNIEDESIVLVLTTILSKQRQYLEIVARGAPWRRLFLANSINLSDIKLEYLRQAQMSDTPAAATAEVAGNEGRKRQGDADADGAAPTKRRTVITCLAP